MPRCALMVRGSNYRQPGQCEKKHGIRKVKLDDVQISACAHHRAMIGRGGVVARVVGARF